MRVALVSLESFYDHSLALDYLITYASSRHPIAGQVEFETFIGGEDASPDKLFRDLVAWRPDLIGFNTYVWNIDGSIAVAKRLKREIPSATIVFGGMEATFNAIELLKAVEDLDFIIIGEGEIPFAGLLDTLLAGNGVTSGPGLGFRDINHLPVIGGLGSVLADLDQIPSPFSHPNFVSRKLNRVLYESYRGCAFRCSFCLYQRDYASQRQFSVIRAKSDLAAIIAAGADEIRFVDATFNLNKQRAKDLLRHLDGCKANVCVEVSAEFFDEEMVSLLAPAGIRHLDIGLQSTQSSPLTAVNREWYRQDRFNRNITFLRSDPRLTLNIELIAGLPGDDLEGFCRSLDDAVSRWPDHVSVYRLLGLRGTPVERDAAKLGLRFAEKPPYELIESSTFSQDILKRLDEITFAHLMLFNLGIGRHALRYLVEILAIRPSVIYSDFIAIILKARLYENSEITRIGRYHAYGNRFDQAMPPGLELDRVRTAIDTYFEQTTLISRNQDRQLAHELIDFGYELAALDGVRQQAENASEVISETMHIAPWIRRHRYSATSMLELGRQGMGLGELTIDEIAAVLFFFLPGLGPSALAIDQALADSLDDLNGNPSEVLDTQVIESLRKMAILV